MDEDAVVERLPVPYAVALRLRAAGADASLIAAGLGIDVEAVAGILRIADAKFEELRLKST